ncbi:hypothetical protein SDC9_135762 [bioreactor metagenome]|uniref:Uncharacterized protein n=1 Tax=bioreactor metagenome TaxID=1076179 RepID=A0A645DI24_9ZZZZ
MQVQQRDHGLVLVPALVELRDHLVVVDGVALDHVERNLLIRFGHDDRFVPNDRRRSFHIRAERAKLNLTRLLREVNDHRRQRNDSDDG